MRTARPLHTAAAVACLAAGLVGCGGRLEGVVLGAGGSAGDGGPAAACYTAVAPGRAATCVIRGAGTLECYGANDAGQLGVPTPAATWQHVEVNLGGPAVQVAAGQGFACARRIDNTLWCWGLVGGADGQLGNGATAGSATPIQVEALGAEVIDVAAGESVACARTSDQALWCWGDNSQGALGLGAVSGVEPPTPVPGLDAVEEVCTAGGHVCARGSDGVVWCWGRNNDGETGTGPASTAIMPTPTPVSGSSAVIAAGLACGAHHTCARLRGGSLWCWGRNQEGQLGIGAATAASYVPAPVWRLGTKVEQVTAGAAHTCARVQGGVIECFGSNQLGNMGNTAFSVAAFDPVLIDGLPPAVAFVGAGARHTCVLTTDGSVWCWGDNQHGEIVGGTPADQPAVVVTPLELDCTWNPPLPE